MSNPFDSCSTEYARYRPDYPDALYDYLIAATGIGPSSQVLDIGAGTGKSAAPMARRGVPTLAADPSHAMIKQGRGSYPNLSYLQCISEELPIRDQSVDLITAGQAFHWFDRPRALPGFRRVLRGAGFLAVYWNDRVEAAFVLALERIISSFNPAFDSTYRQKDWVVRIEDTGDFRVVEERDFPFVVPMNAEDWIGMTRSFGYVRAIGDARMPEFERAMQAELLKHDSLDCGYAAKCWLAQKV